MLWTLTKPGLASKVVNAKVTECGGWLACKLMDEQSRANYCKALYALLRGEHQAAHFLSAFDYAYINEDNDDIGNLGAAFFASLKKAPWYEANQDAFDEVEAEIRSGEIPANPAIIGGATEPWEADGPASEGPHAARSGDAFATLDSATQLDPVEEDRLIDDLYSEFFDILEDISRRRGSVDHLDLLPIAAHIDQLLGFERVVRHKITGRHDRWWVYLKILDAVAHGYDTNRLQGHMEGLVHYYGGCDRDNVLPHRQVFYSCMKNAMRYIQPWLNGKRRATKAGRPYRDFFPRDLTGYEVTA